MGVFEKRYKRKGMTKKLCSMILAAAMVMSLGSCGNAGGSGTTEGSEIAGVSGSNGTGMEGSNAQGDSANSQDGNSAADLAIKPVSEKQKISDLYELANGEWIAQVQFDPDDLACYLQEDDEIKEQLQEDFENMKLSDFAEDDPMYKMYQYYEQLCDPKQRNELSMQRVKEMMEHVRGCKTTDDFQALFTDEVYSLFNQLVNVQLVTNSAGNYGPYFFPNPLLDVFAMPNEDELIRLKQLLAQELMCFDYSEAEAQTMADNILKINCAILEFYQSEGGNLTGFNESMWEKQNSKIDLMKLVKENGYEMVDSIGRTQAVLFINENYDAFLSRIITKDNLEALKDFYAYSVLETFKGCCSNELLYLYGHSIHTMIGLEMAPYELDERPGAMRQLLYIDGGAVSDYYAKKHISDAQRQEISEMEKDIIDAYVKMIENTDWLDTRQKERLKTRTKLTTFEIGAYTDFDHMEDVVIGENVVDTTISILRSQEKFKKRMLHMGQMYLDTNYNLFTFNAYYDSDANSVIICDGYFAEDELWNLSYEEKLGYIGSVLAHELGHAYDSRSVCMRKNGEYDDSWDEFWEPYFSSLNQLYYYFDSMKTSNGYQLSGGSVVDEAYADLMGVQVLLDVLAKRENVNYDAFFQSYAKSFAAILRPEYEDFMMNRLMDRHPTSRERVNGILAQFDAFYDTYHVDKKSEFYVKPGERIKPFYYEAK